MQQHYTIGIAGHIDHGKTTLTKALTGIETDRLKEEQDRKISIEVGFAHFTLPNGEEVGVVDVPGHERFIRQMISGVAGIDLVILLVAGDEGVMPQTREHLDILQLLGVKKGIIVISKKDLVEPEYLELVQEEIASTVMGTFMEHAPMIPVSAKSGEGMDQLLNEIEAALANVPSRGADEPFRLPIDRVFTMKGSGTVVTGTIFEGKIKIGEEELRILPQDRPVRVRQLQVHRHKVEEAYAGQRTAINLSGVEYDEIQRGNVLVSPNFLQPTDRIDIELNILSSHDVLVKHRSRVNVYSGTSEVEGTLLFFDRTESIPGDQVYAQLVLDEPIVVKRDDPILLRRPTPALTIGGGKVIYAYGKKYKFRPETVEILKREHLSPLSERLLFRLHKGEEPLLQLSKELTIPWQTVKNALEQLIEEKKVLVFIEGESSALTLIGLTTWLAHPQRMQENEKQLLTLLEKYHRTNPTQIGMRRSECKERLDSWKGPVFDWVVQNLIDKGKVKVSGERLSLVTFEPHLSPHLKTKADHIMEALRKEGRAVSDWGVLAGQVGLNEKEANEVYRFLIAKGDLMEMSDKWAWPMKIWEETVSLLRDKIESPELTVSDVRDTLGLSRKYLIPILEKLDREGYTIRKGDQRFWKNK